MGTCTVKKAIIIRGVPPSTSCILLFTIHIVRYEKSNPIDSKTYEIIYHPVNCHGRIGSIPCIWLLRGHSNTCFIIFSWSSLSLIPRGSKVDNHIIGWYFGIIGCTLFVGVFLFTDVQYTYRSGPQWSSTTYFLASLSTSGRFILSFWMDILSYKTHSIQKPI